MFILAAAFTPADFTHRNCGQPHQGVTPNSTFEVFENGSALKNKGRLLVDRQARRYLSRSG